MTCAIGALLALAVMAGVTNAGVMIALWIIQLSLHSIGQVFWGYGWEIQLLETGMLAAFLCPMRGWRPFASAPPAETIWLMRWLVVRIMLGAGLIKLRGDPCWRDLTCLVYHYETQPNPSPLSWALHHLPRWAHVAGTLFSHAVELGAPLLVVGPLLARRVAGALFVAFQVLLIVSGNLSFLNCLTIVPALACFDDALLLRLVPAQFRARATSDSAQRRSWIGSLVDKLLRGGRAVAPLFARDPFPDAASPPRFVRAELYRYELTPSGTAAWWKRTRVGEYMRPMAKDDPELEAFLRENGLRRTSR